MTILTRISRLFKADIHGILDSLEAPENILKQAVRDMQAEIDKDTQAVVKLSKQHEHLQKHQQSLAAQIQELQQQLHLCLSENNEALAKSVIRKKLQAEGSLKEISGQLTSTSAAKNLKISETDERKEQLQSIRDKLALFSEPSGGSETQQVSESGSTITKDDIEIAYLYEKQCHVDAAANAGDQQ